MHPFASHRQTKVEHGRVGRLTQAYASGGGVGGEGLDKRDALAVAKEDKGQERDQMRARGGRTKHKGSTHVNVIVAGHGGQPPAAPPMAGVGPVGVAPPPPRPMAPAPAMPPAVGGPPGLPPGMPPGLMPPRKSGGRAFAAGGGVKSGPAWTTSMRDRAPFVGHSSGNNKQSNHDIGRGRPVTYKTGGAVEHPKTGSMAPKLPGGAGGGKGRLAKAHRGIKNGKAI